MPGRDLSRKTKKETAPLTPCRFQVISDDFDDAISRIGAFMGAADIDQERQYVLVSAFPDGLVLECGSGGVYCKVTVPAEVALLGYFTMPVMTLRQLRWGSEKVIFSTLMDTNQVEYRGRIRGKLAVPASPDPIIRNRPKKEPEYSDFPRLDFSNVLAASYFKAETMEESQEDVLVRIDTELLEKPFNDGKRDFSHKLSITVHDSYRAAFSHDYCTATGDSATSVMQASILWQFLKGCSNLGTDRFSIGFTDGAIFLRTNDMVCNAPHIPGEVRDVQRWASTFHEDEADFYFIIDTGEFWDAIMEVSSVHERDPDADKRLNIACRGKDLVLGVSGELGSAERKVDVHKGRKGSVIVDFSFLLDSLRLFKKDNQPVRITVWDGNVRMDIQGDVKSTHFMSAMDNE